MQYTVTGVNRMERFIHDMLAYSQAAEGGLEIKPFPCRLALDWALLELQPIIDETGAEIVADELPVVTGDAMRLSQVFKNLIGNAMKYRSEAAPVIRISTVEHNSEHVICIRDNGMGIDPKYFDNIFVLFKRLHGRELAGSGVGLAICKQIVEHHGGRIWVESEPGAGSKFCFTLPKVAVERSASSSN
jgi:light-regulated signal transduction histidine kinase (bacteriophytochrome)